jgi:DNA replication initiation complex subunit (GINS family)
MYSELYDLWKRELQNVELEKLQPDFYSKLADYLRKLKEESRMLDKRTAKARLLRSETRNVKRMLREVVRARYSKLMRKAADGEKVSSDVLTVEEERLLKGVLPLAEAYQIFAKNLFRGHLQQMDIEPERKSVVLRFVKDVPAIIGADMKPYGPFNIEDVASLPAENAKILIKQGLAEKIEAN